MNINELHPPENFAPICWKYHTKTVILRMSRCWINYNWNK